MKMHLLALFAVVACVAADRHRDPATFNFTTTQIQSFAQARQAVKNGTVFSTAIKFGNGKVKLFYDTQDSFKRIQMDITGHFYSIQIYSKFIIDKFFADLDECYRPGRLCKHQCEHRVFGYCDNIVQSDSNWLSSNCFEQNRFNGILLMNVLHVNCTELPSLHAMSRMQFTNEWV